MKYHFLSILMIYVLAALLFAGCVETAHPSAVPADGTDGNTASFALLPSQDEGDVHNAAPCCLQTEAPGTAVYQNEVAAIDASNVSEGYIMVRYTGSCGKVKLQITGADRITYTYNLIGSQYEAFPLSAGDGDYTVAVYENITGSSYAQVLSEILPVSITNEFGPYLYPNQYVDFVPSSRAVAKAAELAQSADSELEVVANVYNYIISHISYDYEKAETVQSGYTADIDAILQTGNGICLDYAAVMAAMLRSRNIPTRLEVGYVQEVYHAWISTYITDMGWVNGIVEFNGTDWELMDPTFAASSSEQSLRKFIGDGSHYSVKYMY